MRLNQGSQSAAQGEVEYSSISFGRSQTGRHYGEASGNFYSPYPSPHPDCLWLPSKISSLISAHPDHGDLPALLPQQAHVNINTYCAAGAKRYCSLSCTKAASTRRVTSHGATSQQVIRIDCTPHLKDCAENGQCDGQTPLPSLI